MAGTSVSTVPSGRIRAGILALGLIAKNSGLKLSPAGRLTIWASKTSSNSSRMMWIAVEHEPGVI